MYKYKITLKVCNDFNYTISTESDWVADEEVAFQESHEIVNLLCKRYPNWDRVNCYVKLYSSDRRAVRKTWKTEEFNWGVE